MTRPMAIATLAVACCACGGGGYSVDSDSLSFYSPSVNSAAPGPQTIVVHFGDRPVAYGYSGEAIDSVQDLWESDKPAQGKLIVYPTSPGVLGVGRHAGEVVIGECADEACDAVIEGSIRHVRVSYVVDGIACSGVVYFETYEGDPAPTSELTCDRPAASSAWAAAVTDLAGDGWLSVAPTRGDRLPATLTLTAAPRPAGSYAADLSVATGISMSTTMGIVYVVHPNLTVAPVELAFDAIEGQRSPPAARGVAASLHGATPVSLQSAVAYSADASGWLSVEGDAAPGTLRLVPTAVPPAGTHTATVTLAPGDGSTAAQVQVTYRVAPASMALAPDALAFRLDAASTPGPGTLARTVQTSDAGVQVPWTATATAPWLGVTPRGVSGDAATVELVPAALAALPYGRSSAEVRFTFTRPGGATAVVALPVTLDLELPTVGTVAPYVSYAGDPQEVIVRGHGFDALATPRVLFGGAAAASTTRISDTELRAIPPTLAAGRYPVTITNAFGIARAPRGAELVVRPAATFPYALVEGAYGMTQASHLVFDGERSALLSVEPSYPDTPASGNVTRLAYGEDGRWTRTVVNYYSAEVADVALDVDGRSLLALGRTQLLYLDPVTLALQRAVDLPHFSSPGQRPQLWIRSDGGVLIRDWGDVYVLDENGTTDLPYPGYAVGELDGSADGSHAFVGPFREGPINYALAYDARSPASLAATTTTEWFEWGSVDRSGDRAILVSQTMGSVLWSGEPRVLGTLPIPGGSLPPVISPDGSRAYTVFWVYTGGQPLFTPEPLVRVFDLTQRSFPQLPSIPLPDSRYPDDLLVSPDGRTLFLVDDISRLIVIPLQ